MVLATTFQKSQSVVFRWSATLFLWGLASLGCRQQVEVHPDVEVASKSERWFQDISLDRHLSFIHDAGSREKYFMPGTTGSGAALLDFNRDGLLDVYLLNNGGPESESCNHLFRQLPTGQFEDVSQTSGLDVTGYGQGVAVGDMNNDGWPDLCVTEFGRVRLFLNQQNNAFRELAEPSGVESPRWATSAAFLDFDRDGWLDLCIVNYVEYNSTKSCFSKSGRREFCGPSAFNPSVTCLYRNLGNPTEPTFSEVTLESGLASHSGPGLGVVCVDFDGDRWVDIFVANDGRPNHLWINQRNGTFLEEAMLRGIAVNRMGQAEANMGIAIGDIDNDGLFDLFSTHLTSETHSFWKQTAVGAFTDDTVSTRISETKSTGFGTILADFDNDGDLDLAVATGRVTALEGIDADADSFWTPYLECNGLFENDGSGTFKDVSAVNPDFCGTPDLARGLACGDIDNDGGLDLILTRVDGPASGYRNIVANRGHWLSVRAVEPPSGRDAQDAEITVFALKHRWKRSTNPSGSYACSNDPRSHFGLGDHSRVDSIEIVWPDGLLERFPGMAADQFVELQKGTGTAVAAGAEVR